MSGQQHAPAALYPRERPGTHFTVGWVGPRAGLGVAENLVATRIRSQTLQLVVSRYTDWATDGLQKSIKILRTAGFRAGIWARNHLYTKQSLQALRNSLKVEKSPSNIKIYVLDGGSLPRWDRNHLTLDYRLTKLPIEAVNEK